MKRLIWRLLFSALVGGLYGLLMVVLEAPWLHVGLLALCFGTLGWCAFPGLFGEQGRGFCEH